MPDVSKAGLELAKLAHAKTMVKAVERNYVVWLSVVGRTLE